MRNRSTAKAHLSAKRARNNTTSNKRSGLKNVAWHPGKNLPALGVPMLLLHNGSMQSRRSHIRRRGKGSLSARLAEPSGRGKLRTARLRACRRSELLLNPTRADRFHRTAGSGPQSPHARHIEALDTRERLRLLREDGSKTTRPTIAKSWSIWAQFGRPLTRSGGLRSRWPIDWDLTIGHLQAVQEWTDAAEKLGAIR
jgi:hypothetical protein